MVRILVVGFLIVLALLAATLIQRRSPANLEKLALVKEGMTENEVDSLIHGRSLRSADDADSYWRQWYGPRTVVKIWFDLQKRVIKIEEYDVQY